MVYLLFLRAFLPFLLINIRCIHTPKPCSQRFLFGWSILQKNKTNKNGKNSESDWLLWYVNVYAVHGKCKSGRNNRQYSKQGKVAFTRIEKKNFELV